MEQTPLRSSGRKSKNLIRKTIIFLIIFIIIDLLIIATINFLPTFQRTKINDSSNIYIYYNGEKTNYIAIDNDNQLYLPYSFIKEYIDDRIALDEDNNYVIITTEKEVFHFSLVGNEGLLNLDPYSFTYPSETINDEVYLSLDPLNKIYDIDGFYNNGENIALINKKGEPIQKGIVTENTKLRDNSSIFSPWLHKVYFNQEVKIIKEENGWYWVELTDGKIGYIDKDMVELTLIEFTKIEKEEYHAWNPIGEPIVLTFEYATLKTTNTNQIGEMPSLKVLSPTWFHLQENGLVANSADIDYVEWAHNNGYQVWGLFSNSFDLDLTHKVLSDSEQRIKVIKQLLNYVELYQLDGINVDFENVYLKDKDLFVQFIRELTPLMHELDRTVSIDITFKSGSENWSLFYDREQLGEIADYIIVMGYDEHWANSPKAGSVASIPWVEKGVIQILEEVPKDKLILGIPFYTRLWIEEENEDGQKTVKSETMTMRQAEEWIANNNVEVNYDEKSGQNYAELVNGNTTYKIWLEDSLSINKRLEIMDKYDLAGIAAWRRGFETIETWHDISSFIDEGP